MNDIPERQIPKTILVVDDNRDAATTLSMLLNLKGYKTHICYAGREAINAVAELQPDLVILDLAMPDMDGYQTATLLRETHGSSLPLVALSGYSQREDKNRSMDAGFNAHLVKPVDLNALITLIAALLPGTESIP
jgi:CheY-like chemotaxis protein